MTFFKAVHFRFLGAALALLGSACGGGPPESGGTSTVQVQAPSGEGPLTSSEAAFLRYLREEEKLARDVYLAVGAGSAPFDNIAGSEQAHMDAIAPLLSRYSIADPALGKAQGAFENPSLGALYEALVQAGTKSRIDALRVGVEIEELDLFDIEQGVVDIAHADIVTTTDSLARGSRNHLRTFYAQLVAQGGSYVPQHLARSEFDSIVTSEKETGGR